MQRPEEAFQKSVCELLAWAAPHDLVWFAVPNQRGTRKRFEQALLAGLGVKAGVGDLCFILPPDGQFGCVELKAKGRKPTPEQFAFGDAVARAGGVWAWARTLEEFTTILEVWGVSLRVAA